jgi:hypothetical protein
MMTNIVANIIGNRIDPRIMRKDPTEFRQRFAAWKNGEKPYENGLPKYKDGDEPVKVGEYNVYPSVIGATELNVTTPEIVITGKDRRPLY